jgi:uncharacterized protein (UPF0248 family)
MVTLRELLARIRWDEEFGGADFVLACYDRVSGTLERLPLASLRLEPGNHFAFEAQDDQGLSRSIPYHRVREVYRNGALIWARPD